MNRLAFATENSEWLTVEQAAQILGCANKEIYPILGELLFYRRPAGSEFLVMRIGVELLKNFRALDPESAAAKAILVEIRQVCQEAIRTFAIIQEDRKEPEPVREAADDNLSDEWAKGLFQMGLSLVLVGVKSGPDVWKRPSFAEDIGQALECVALGKFDSSKQRSKAIWNFYLVPTRKLDQALAAIRAALDGLGLLALSWIGHNDPKCGVWRTWKERQL